MEYVNLSNKGHIAQATVEVTANTTSKPVIIPCKADKISAMIAPAPTGTAKLQITLSSLAEILAGTAVWIDQGTAVSAVTLTNLAGVCTAIRAVNTAGTVKLIVAAG